MVAGVEAAAFGVLWLNLRPQPSLVLLMTSAIVSVYVAGMAAAVKLLTGRRERVTALIGLAVSLLIAASCGWYLLWPVAIGALALGYRVLRRTKVEVKVDVRVERNALNSARVAIGEGTRVEHQSERRGTLHTYEHRASHHP